MVLSIITIYSISSMPRQLHYTRHADLLSPFKSLFQGGEWPTPDYRLLFNKKKNPPKPKEKKEKAVFPDHRPPTNLLWKLEWNIIAVAAVCTRRTGIRSCPALTEKVSVISCQPATIRQLLCCKNGVWVPRPIITHACLGVICNSYVGASQRDFAYAVRIYFYTFILGGYIYGHGSK